MKLNNLIILVLLFCSGWQFNAFGQMTTVPSDNPLRKSPPLWISIGANVQSWSPTDGDITQISIPVVLRTKPMPGLNASLGLSQAMAEKEGFEQINGITDLQLGLDYTIYPQESSRIIFSLGAQLPTGTTQFSDEEYQTAFRLGFSQFGFNVPFYGQGLRIAPGITYITSLSNSMVLSLGGAYRYRGSFDPISDLPEGYDWGNEILMTVGIGARIGSTLFFALDGTYTMFDADRIGGAEVYESGNRLWLSFQANKQIAANVIGVGVTYHSIDENQIPRGNALIPEVIRAYPGILNIHAGYSHRLSEKARVETQGDLTRYQEDTVFEELVVFRLSLAATFTLSPSFSIPVIGRYGFGDLSGFEAGLGVDVIF